MSFRQYGQCKDSGVPWLGQIPRHWEAKRIRYLASRISSGKTPFGGSDVYVDEGIIFLRSQNVYDEGLQLDDVVFISETIDAQMAVSRVQPKDILLNITGASIGRSCVVPIDFPPANVNQHVCAIRMANQGHVPFVGWCFKSGALKAQIDFMQNGAAREGLTFDQIARLWIAVPPRNEQDVVADFLERETAKIHALIAEQQSLIGLLKEKRQSVICQAVTKGLHRNASMVDSGIPWWGDVPKHWTLSPLKRAFDAIDYGISDSLESAGAIAVLRMGNISGGKVILEDLKYVDAVEPSLLLRSGDLLYNRTNSLDLIGKVGLYLGDSEVPISFASYLVRLRTRASCEPNYFAYLLNTPGVLGEARSNAIVAIGQCNLNPTRYGAFIVAIPPRTEQLEIARYLDRETADLDALTGEAESAIALLEERRSALISAAVTGKIDARGQVATQPKAEVAA